MGVAARLVLIFLCGTLGIAAEHTIPATEAAKHVGEKTTVCGVVASTHYASGRKGQPTFLNLDKPYPNAIFTALIWGENRSKFNEPEVRPRQADLHYRENHAVRGCTGDGVAGASQLREEQ